MADPDPKLLRLVQEKSLERNARLLAEQRLRMAEARNSQLQRAIRKLRTTDARPIVEEKKNVRVDTDTDVTAFASARDGMARG